MKNLEEFTHYQIKSLINHLKKYYRDGEPEMLHQIRVDIKKIKAILSAINGCLKGFKAHRNFMPFRNIFRRAGDIREPGVLAQYQVEGIASDEMSSDVEQLAIAFKADVQHFIRVVKNNAKKLESFSRQVHHDDFMWYLARKKKKVKSQLYPRPKMVIIHKVRKSIKEVVYLSEVRGKPKKKEAKFYDKMQDAIGRLHDKQILLDLLKKKANAGSRTQREAIKSECRSDKKEIFSLASDFYE